MMEFDRSFEMAMAPVDLWPLLLDVQLVSACMPGATLTRMLDRDNYEGRLTMTVGPVSLSFDGMVSLADVSFDDRIVWIGTRGSDGERRGGVVTLTELHLQPSEKGSQIGIHVCVKLTGGFAPYNGIGLLEVAGEHIADQFAENLQAHLAWHTDGETAEPPSVTAKPMSTTSLMGRTVWRKISKTFQR
jgi:carbon monoxide dehydrogenase subunit G